MLPLLDTFSDYSLEHKSWGKPRRLDSYSKEFKGGNIYISLFQGDREKRKEIWSQ